MANDEPVLLYANNAAQFSMLSWRADSSAEANYLAVPDRDRRRKIKLGADRKPEFETEIRRAGGVWTRMEPTRGQFQMQIRVCPKDDYQPPSRMFVLGAGGKVEPRHIGNDAVSLKASEYALLPVDLPSEKQLEGWLEGLKGLPGDLGEATLQSIVSEGLQSSRRPPQFGGGAVDAFALESSQPESRMPAWVWMAVTGVLGLVLGAAAGYFAPHAGSAALAAPATAKGPTVKPGDTAPKVPAAAGDKTLPGDSGATAFAKSLRGLEEALLQSKRSNVKALLDGEVKQYPLDKDSPERRNSEAWMMVKLVMADRNLAMDPALNKTDKAKEFFDKELAKSQNSDRSAMLGAFCLAGTAPDAALCKDVDWGGAQDKVDILKALAEPAAATPAPATDPKKKEKEKAAPKAEDTAPEPAKTGVAK